MNTYFKFLTIKYRQHEDACYIISRTFKIHASGFFPNCDGGGEEACTKLQIGNPWL